MLERRTFPVVMMLPAAALIVLVVGFPILFNGWLMFQTWNIRTVSNIRFVGLANFERMFADTVFWNSFANTFQYVAMAVTCEFLAGLGLALVLQHQFRGAALIRSIIMVPLFIVPVIVALIWRIIYNQEFGPLYYTLQTIGMVKGGGSFGLSSPAAAMAFIVVASLWQVMPFVFLVFVAGLQGIPKERYEAARIDGANTLQEFLHITLPALKSLILFILLFRIMESFKVFDLVVMLTGGGPGSSTEVTSLYIYRQAFQYFDMGYAAVLAVTLMAVVMVMSLVLINLMRVQKNV
jgi:multiple sugar transport system permease protein